METTMPFMMPSFEIDDINIGAINLGIVYATVKFHFDEKIDEIEVTNIVSVKVRVKAQTSLTIQDIQKVLFEKAVETLAQANLLVEGKDVSQLISASEEKIRRET
jgi:hypothetical protein